MLSYLSAELWKLRRHKGLWVGLALLLGLETLIFLPWFWYPDVLPYRRDVLYVILATALLLGLLLVPLFAVAAFDDQHGRGTLKNETVYGVPRSRSYLGKLLSAAVAGTLAAALAVGWYLLLTWLLSASGSEGDVTLTALLTVLAVYYLVWLAQLSLTFFLLAVCKSAAGAVTAAYLVTLLGSVFALLGAGDGSALWYRLAVDLFFAAPLRELSLEAGYTVGYTGLLFQLLDENTLLYALLVSALWVSVTTALGLAIFRRREIK